MEVSYDVVKAEMVGTGLGWSSVQCHNDRRAVHVCLLTRLKMEDRSLDSVLGARLRQWKGTTKIHCTDEWKYRNNIQVRT